MKTIVLASNNKHKIEEYKQILSNFNIVTMNSIGFTEDIIENGKTFLDNSLIKAKAVYDYCLKNNFNYNVLADDSGLVVNSLNGEPGVYSARYSGEHGNSKANRQKVLEKLQDKKDRSAYFICSLTFINDKGNVINSEGKTEGTILLKEQGYDGFGYDCIFLSNDLNKCFGDATSEEKNSVSHRKRAIENLLIKLKENNII